MKKFIKLTALLLVLALSLFAAGCSSYDRLEKAFLENGFALVTEIEEDGNLLKDDLTQGIREVEVYEFKKTAGLLNLESVVAVVFEFKSVKELTQAVKQSEVLSLFIDELEQDEELDDIYEELVEDGYANGKCLVVPITFSGSSKQQVTSIVRSAYLISPDLF